MSEPSRATSEALRRADETARNKHRTVPSTADLVAGIVSLDRGVGIRALTDLGISRDDVQRHLEAAPPEEAFRSKAAMGFTMRFAGAAATITTGHLLVGALSDPTCAAAQALVMMGIKVDSVRTKVEDLLTSGLADDALPQRQIPLAQTPSADHNPITLPWTLVIGESDLARVAFDNVSVYPAGFEFRITIVVAPGRRIPDIPWLYAEEGGLTVRLVTALGAQYELIERRQIRSAPPAAMLVASEPSPEYLASSAARRADYMIWAWPVPPDQPLEIVCLWPGMSITHTRTRLDGAAIRSASVVSTPIWQPR